MALEYNIDDPRYEAKIQNRIKSFKALWNLSEETIERVVRGFQGYYDEIEEYLEFMEGEETTDPFECYPLWCILYNIEQEVSYPPFYLDTDNEETLSKYNIILNYETDVK